jgi:hypothetical protein
MPTFFHTEIIFILLLFIVGILALCTGILSFRKRQHKHSKPKIKKVNWFIKKDSRISKIISILVYIDHDSKQNKRSIHRKSLQKIKLIFELRSRIKKLSPSIPDNEVNKICQEIILIVKYSKKRKKLS